MVVVNVGAVAVAVITCRGDIDRRVTFSSQGMSEQLLVRLTKQNSSIEMYSPIRRHIKNN